MNCNQNFWNCAIEIFSSTSSSNDMEPGARNKFRVCTHYIQDPFPENPNCFETPKIPNNLFDVPEGIPHSLPMAEQF